MHKLASMLHCITSIFFTGFEGKEGGTNRFDFHSRPRKYQHQRGS